MKGFKYIFLFVLAVALQVFLFNNIFFMGYMNPYIYIIFILYLPISMPRSGLLIVAFLMGISIDIFENSGGIHASASVLLAYARPLILRIVSRRHESDIEDMKISGFGFLSMFIYAFFGTLIHHFTLFILESFRLSDFGAVLLRTIYSTIFTIIFVLVVQLWNFRRRKS